MMKAIVFITVIVLFLIQDEVKGQSKVMKCSRANDRCELPFTFNDKSYEACTPDGVPSKRPWCPTKIYANGSAHVYYCMECWAEQRCYYNGASFPDSSWLLSCPPGCYHAQKYTYGTDNEFSAASYVCSSAMHEGLLTNDTGGVIKVTKTPWKKDFVGAEKNGVRTYKGKKDDSPMMKVEIAKIAQPPHILFTHEQTMISALPPGSVTYDTLNDKQNFATGMACDVRRKKIFWSDVGKRLIYRADYDGKKITNQKVILGRTQVLKAEYLAVDWIYSNLLWTDIGHHSLSISDPDGNHVRTLLKRADFDPRGLAVDPLNGYVYVADSSANPKILKCSMSKKKEDACETIVQNDIESPTGVAIDARRNQLCWADSAIPQISCAGLDGSRRRNMKFSSERLKQPIALMIFNGRVYWTDWLATILASADIASWTGFHVHLGDITKASGLTAFDQRAQVNYLNRCNTAPCEQLCVPKPGGYMCACADGLHLQPDATCSGKLPPQDRLDIYVADFNNLKRVEIDLETRDAKSLTILNTSLRRATAVAVDAKKKMVYWSDSVQKKIEFAPISNNLVAGRNVFLREDSGYVHKVEDIAIDSVARLLYWTDTAQKKVLVARLDAQNGQYHVRVLINSSGTYTPRSIALDPKRGYFYILNVESTVHKCGITEGNTNCKMIVKSGLNSPQMITIDADAERLYISQSDTGKQIFSCDLEGGDQKTIRFLTSRNAYGIGVHKNRVYISDRRLNELASANKNTGADEHTIIKGLKRDTMGISLYDPLKKEAGDYDNVCAGNTCQYMCVPTPNRGGRGYTCVCPERYMGRIGAPKECSEAKQTIEALLNCKPGYMPNRATGKCTDIVECDDRNAGCQHICINSLGSFFCKCKPGYALQADQRSCEKKAEPCADKPCKNGGTCEVKDDKSGYVCKCKKGFKGTNCEAVDARLVQSRDGIAIIMQCICPDDVVSEVLWLLNRNEIDPAERWALVTKKGREMTIHRPHYTYSGNFTCQFTYGGFEYIARTLVIIKSLPSTACGDSFGPDIPARRNTPKILGGRQTIARSAPFVAMLYKKKEDPLVKKGVFCGGSLIDTKTVVTAAHCFHSVAFKNVIVYVGKVIANIANIEREQQSSEILDVIVHPDHYPRTLEADIAIIILKEEVYYSLGVKPLCVADPTDPDPDIKPRAARGDDKKYGIVYGYGLTEKSVNAKRLMEVDLPIIKDPICEGFYEPGEITSLMYCIGGEKKKDACEGDSGSPFTLWSRKRQRWYLAGIVSWGVQCGRTDKPGVYTRIGKKLRGWIRDNSDQ